VKLHFNIDSIHVKKDAQRSITTKCFTIYSTVGVFYFPMRFICKNIDSIIYLYFITNAWSNYKWLITSWY